MEEVRDTFPRLKLRSLLQACIASIWPHIIPVHQLRVCECVIGPLDAVSCIFAQDFIVVYRVVSESIEGPMTFFIV